MMSWRARDSGTKKVWRRYSEVVYIVRCGLHQLYESVADIVEADGYVFNDSDDKCVTNMSNSFASMGDS